MNEDMIWTGEETSTNPYETPVQSTHNKRAVVAADAVVEAAASGGDPTEAFNSAMSSDIPSMEAQLASEGFQSEVGELTDAVGALAETDPETLVAASADLPAMYQEIEQTYSGKLGPYIAGVRRLPGAAEATDEEVRDVAAQKYINARIAELFDEDYNWADATFDVAGLLAWPDLAYDVAETMGTMVGEDGIEDYLSTGDLIIKFGKVMEELEPEQRVELFDVLNEKLSVVEDNEIKRAIMLMYVSGDATNNEIKLDATFDKLDAATLGLSSSLGILRTIKSVNRLRSIVKMAGADREAGYIADVAASSEEGARAMGVSRLDAAASVDPNASGLSDILDGAAQGVATRIRDQWRMIDEKTDEALNIQREGLGLSQTEMERAAAKRGRAVAKQEGVENVHAIPNADGILLQFDKVDPTTMNVETIQTSVPYTVDDVTGGFTQTGVTFLGELGKSVLNSPNYLQGADRDRLVQSFERTLFASSKIKRELNDAFNTINKGLSKVEAENVGKILAKGDDENRVFSFKELVDEGIGGIKLSEKEFTAYAGTRKLMDNMWAVKNDEIRKRLITKGVREIDVDGELVTGKVYISKGDASSAYLNSTFRTISVPEPLHGTTKKLDNISPDELAQYYDEGYQLVRPAESGNFVRAEDTLAEWALVREHSIRDLPMEVLNKRNGYIPRAYENANFFVKESRKLNVANRDVSVGTRTLRYFDNATDANKFIDELEQAAKAEGRDFDRADYRVLGDREMTVADLEDDFINMYGGMYTGARSEEALKFGLLAEEGKRVDPLESIQNYINHIGNRYPLAEYRMGIERRWMKHAKDHGAIPKDYVGSFREAIGLVENSPADSLVKTKLINAHSQIQYMNKVQTVGEQQWAGTMRAIGRSMEKIPGVGKGLAKYAYRLDHTAPVDAIRGATFNLMLGMYNWSQFFVQASGATVAMSIHPHYAPRAIGNMLAFGVLDNIQDAGARAGAIKKIASMPGYEGIAEEYALWKRSGMFDSVVNTNADVSTIYRGLPYDATLVRKVWTNGTLPYKMGELANMRISFGIALKEWQAANKGKVADDKALRTIMARAENFRLSMSKANTSSWQRGWMAIPTQFQQINARFFEALLGKHFSGRDKTMFLLGQTVMFGAAGVPFADLLYGTINNAIGRDITQVESSDIIAERRGMIGWVLNHYADIDANVTGRVAIAGGVIQSLVDMSTNPAHVTDVLLGPSASTKDNLVGLIQSLAMTGKVAVNIDELSAKDAGMLLQANLTALAQLPASTRNLLLANDLYNNDAYRTKDGKARFDVDANWQTMIAQAAGFQQQSKADYWMMVMGKKKEAERMKGDVDRISIMYLNMMRFAETDEEQSRAYELAIDATIQGYKDEQDRIRVMNAVRKRLTEENDAIGKQVLEMLKTYTSKFSDKGALYNPLVTDRLQEGNE